MGWLRGLTVNEIVRCATRPDVGLWWGVSGFFRWSCAVRWRSPPVFPVFSTRQWMRCFPMVHGSFMMGRVAWIGDVL